MNNNLLSSLVEATYEYLYAEKGVDLALIPEAMIVREERVSHSLEEVLKDFKHYVKRYNRYRMSLVKPYAVPEKPFLPGLEKAA